MDDKRLDAILNNDFVLDCTRIVLTQIEPGEWNSENIIYSGPGTISQDGNGQFFVKVFCGGKPPKSEFVKVNHIKPGKIIDHSELYALSATDIEGISWQADQILPNITGHINGDYIVQGHLGKLSCVNQISGPIKKNHLLMNFMGDIEIPCNKVTSSKTYVGEEERAYSANRNVASFVSCGFEFEITKKDKWLTVSVTSDSIINDALITRVTESIQFVLGRSFPGHVIEVTQEGLRKTYIKPPYELEVKFRAIPPIEISTIDHGTWALFDKYLNHFIDYEEERWHPTYGIIHSVIQSSAASVEAQALTVSVAVEGLLKNEFSGLGKPGKRTKEQIALAKKIITESELDSNIKDRIFGSLGAMGNVSPKDRLFELRNQDLIEQRLISCWKKLRPSSVHADELNYEDLQKYLDLYKSVLVLFYQLIFLAVGYTGNFTDYSEYGFPLKPFDKKMV